MQKDDKGNEVNKDGETTMDKDSHVVLISTNAMTTSISKLGRSSVNDGDNNMMIVVKGFVASNICSKMKFINNKEKMLQYDVS